MLQYDCVCVRGIWLVGSERLNDESVLFGMSVCLPARNAPRTDGRTDVIFVIDIFNSFRQ